MQFLFVTNAGDDTLSMFVIDAANPEHPSLVGKPVPTLGETPISVAYSPRLKTGQLHHFLFFENSLLTSHQPAFSMLAQSPA